MLEGLGLEVSYEGGEGFGRGKVVMLWGSTPPSGGIEDKEEKSKGGFGEGAAARDEGNCFWRRARKSSSAREEKLAGC